MYSIIVFAIFTWLAYVINGQVNVNLDLIKTYRATTQQADLIVAAQNLKQYYMQFGSYPASMLALSTTPGYEHVKSSMNVNQGYSLSGSIVDAVWTFKRATIFNYNPGNGDTVSSLTTANTCGVGSFNSATSWCGPVNSLWFRVENREIYNDSIVNQRIKQQRFLQKFASYFNDQQIFPNKDQSAASLVAGTSYSVSTLAGYAGLANNCSGNFAWRGVPIDCSEMFDQWGGNISYTYFSDTHIAIVSSTPILNQLGGKVNIATDLDAT